MAAELPKSPSYPPKPVLPPKSEESGGPIELQDEDCESAGETRTARSISSTRVTMESLEDMSREESATPDIEFVESSSLRECEGAGLVCSIGPAPDSVARIRDKVAARQAAIEAGVQVIPGTPGPITNAKEAVDFARQYGTPIILKAAFGRSRIVNQLDKVEEAFRRSYSEAQGAFGDGSLFVEKFIDVEKRVEVQVKGNIIHLFERDCSVERRRWEEDDIDPAPALPPGVRDKILNDAVRLSKHVGFQNAGTVEFLVDQKGKYFVIEVNARLQVEMKTEEITGVELVQSQIRIAEGKTLKDLKLSEESIVSHGSAIPCRVTSEDPARGFHSATLSSSQIHLRLNNMLDEGTLKVKKGCAPRGRKVKEISIEEEEEEAKLNGFQSMIIHGVEYRSLKCDLCEWTYYNPASYVRHLGDSKLHTNMKKHDELIVGCTMCAPTVPLKQSEVGGHVAMGCGPVLISTNVASTAFMQSLGNATRQLMKEEAKKRGFSLLH